MGKISTVFIIVIGILLLSCQQDIPKNSENANGVWQQIGYGNTITINDTLLRVYHTSASSCSFSHEEHILDFGKVTRIKEDTLTIEHGIDKWLFTRRDELPKNCMDWSARDVDPKLNFQVFWETFDEHYVSFQLKNVDWNSIYEEYESKINKNTTNLELYTYLQEIIALLDDGHVVMDVPESLADGYVGPTQRNKQKYSKIEELALAEKLATLYEDSLRTCNGGMLRYGTIGDSLGYIQINAMFMLADYRISSDLDLQTFYGGYWEKAQRRKDELQRQDEVDGISEILNKIIGEFSSIQSIVLDLRFNGGGKDGVALEILNHFANEKRFLFSKKARKNDGFTEPQKLHAIPSDKTFKGNVYVLTSYQTASAAEVLVLGSLAFDNFMRIGSRTEGIFSSTLDKTLPNGWEYTLSNEVYEDVDGTNYEHTGISPNHSLAYPKNREAFLNVLANELKAEKDSAIELILNLEKKTSEDNR